MYMHTLSYTHKCTHTYIHRYVCRHIYVYMYVIIMHMILYVYACRNHRVLQEAPQHCTRFISLANVGNPDKKQRFLYAFNITPLSGMSSSELTAQPQSLTDCPYAKSVTSHHRPQVSLYTDAYHVKCIQYISIQYVFHCVYMQHAGLKYCPHNRIIQG